MSFETIIAILGALGLGGLLGALLNRRFEQQKQTNEHDIKIFNQSNEILDEQKILEILGIDLLNDHSITYEDSRLLFRFIDFFEKKGNYYLDKRISKEAKELILSMRQMKKFVDINFLEKMYQNPNNAKRYLKPDWNIDRGYDISEENIDKYREYAKELFKLTEKTMEQYSKYRIRVKQSLKI